MSRSRSTSVLALALVLALLVACFPAGAGADTPDPAQFKVGTSVVDITPTTPMYVGGYGSGTVVTGGSHDPLQVRAFFVGHGTDAVAFVSVDAQGWFGEYQTPNVGDGMIDARAKGAAALTQAGYTVTPANVIISSTHTHAAPTLQGIWGHTDPAYLHRVHDAAVQAVQDAAAAAQPATLWSANGTIRSLLSEKQGTDQMAGFATDNTTPLLWARKPGTGATIGLYANVPVHADQYNPTAAGNNQFSADYPGWVRDRLHSTLGGTSVIAMGTLGRQEAIGDDSSYNEVVSQGTFVSNAITRALRSAHQITDTTVAAGSKQFTTAAQNTNLIAGMRCNHGGFAAFGCATEPASNLGSGTWLWPAGQIFTINRSLTPPYFDGTNLGTNSAVARIGDQLYVTAPGEAFPEVTHAVQRAFAGTDGVHDVHIVDHALDQLGYYWDPRAGAYPAAQLAQSDFVKFNVGSGLAQDNVNAARDAGALIGLSSTAQTPSAEQTNPSAFAQPTIQFYPSRVEGTSHTVSLYGSARKAQAAGAPSTSIGSSVATPADNLIAWDFGDGTTTVRSNSGRFDHTFPAPGTYEVKATVYDNLGTPYRWVQSVTIDPPLNADVTWSAQDDQLVLEPKADGGAGDVVAAHWSFSDGTTADGLKVTRPVPAAPIDATVSIVDSAGNTADKTVSIRYADPGTPALTTGTSPNATGLFGLGWSGSDPATSGIEYALQHRDADDADWSAVGTGLADRAFAFSAAGEAEGTWTYRVQGSHDGNLTTAWSGTSDAVKVDRTAPSAPGLAADRAPDYAGDGGWYRDSVSVSYADNGDPALADGSTGSGVDAASVPVTATVSANGATTLHGTVKDNAGNESEQGSFGVQVDAAAPKLSLACPTAVLLHASASATTVASDDESGLAADPSGSSAIDTSTVGPKTTSRTATDNVGHAVTKTCTTQVQYMYGGLQQPVNTDGSSIFKLNSAVPLKFQLTDFGARAVSNAVATVSVAKITNAVEGTFVEAEAKGNSSTGNVFSQDGSGQYHYNLDSKTMSSGTWSVKVTLNDGTTYTTHLSLR